MNNYLMLELSPQQQAAVVAEYDRVKKDKTLLILLWIFTGIFGGHRFYLGNPGYAVCLLLFSWITLGLWTLVDIFFAVRKLDIYNEAKFRNAIDRARAHVAPLPPQPQPPQQPQE